jgi:hypothetical protein
MVGTQRTKIVLRSKIERTAEHQRVDRQALVRNVRAAAQRAHAARAGVRQELTTTMAARSTKRGQR